MPKVNSIESLIHRQLESFGLNDSAGLASAKSAEKFLMNAGMALRYWGTKGLPLASLYQAVWGRVEAPYIKRKGEPAKIHDREEVLKKGIELVNHLLDSHLGIEVNVIAKRLTLIHRALVPSLYVLVRNHRVPADLKDISPEASKVFKMIEQNKETTAGVVRKFLGIKSSRLDDDPAYKILAELQSRMLVDRGPFIMRKKGVPYLSKEGYPYHCFHLAHNDLVKVSRKINRKQAAEDFVLGYLQGAVFTTEKKLASLFGEFLSPEDVRSITESLSKKRLIRIEKLDQKQFLVTGK